jgi:hypothetical protein
MRGCLRVFWISRLRYDRGTRSYGMADGLDCAERFVNDLVEQLNFFASDEDAVRRGQ